MRLTRAAAFFDGIAPGTRRAAILLGTSAGAFYVLLGPLQVSPNELAVGTSFVIWQAVMSEAIRPGRGGRP